MRILGTWPRVVEAMLGVWLIASPAVFGSAGVVNERIVGIAVILFSVLSFFRRTAWAQWLTGLASLWLGAVPYFRLDRPGPPAAQNDITVALLLLMIFILPTYAADPPHRTRRSGA